MVACFGITALATGAIIASTMDSHYYNNYNQYDNYPPQQNNYNNNQGGNVNNSGGGGDIGDTAGGSWD